MLARNVGDISDLHSEMTNAAPIVRKTIVPRDSIFLGDSSDSDIWVQLIC